MSDEPMSPGSMSPEAAVQMEVVDVPDPGRRLSETLAEHDGGAAFWIGIVVGWAVIVAGVRMGIHDRELKPGLLLKWMVGGLILHDAIWLPVLAVLGAGLSLAVRRRVPPFVAWAVATSAVLTLIAWPFVRGYGRRADVPSALQRNYARGLIAYIAVTWAIALIALGITVARRRPNAVIRSVEPESVELDADHDPTLPTNGHEGDE